MAQKRLKINLSLQFLKSEFEQLLELIISLALSKIFFMSLSLRNSVLIKLIFLVFATNSIIF